MTQFERKARQQQKRVRWLWRYYTLKQFLRKFITL